MNFKTLSSKITKWTVVSYISLTFFFLIFAIELAFGNSRWNPSLLPQKIVSIGTGFMFFNIFLSAALTFLSIALNIRMMAENKNGDK